MLKLFLLPEVSYQHDGACPHNGHGNQEFLREAGKASPGSRIITVIQCLDINSNDPCLFNGLSKRSHEIDPGAKTHAALRYVLVQALNEYPHDRLTRFHA
jgi:hypothetical protein